MKMLTVAFLFVASVAGAQQIRPSVYVAPTDDGMHTYISAALFKKKTPVQVVTDQGMASHILTAAPVEIEEVTTGKRVVNCLFAYCAGNENKASTSVTFATKDGTVEWSYSVNKGRGAKNLQSMAEAIAKHLGNHLKDQAKRATDEAKRSLR
jgi:hypothetical protein